MAPKLQIDKFGFRLVKVTLPVLNHKENYLWDKCGFPLAEEWKKQKTFFRTHGWEYGFKCVGGLQVTWHFGVQLFSLPSAIAWPSFRWAFFNDPFVLVFLVFCYIIRWRRRGRTQDLVLWKDCSHTTVVQTVIQEMLERNAVSRPMPRHTTILVRDRPHTHCSILQTGPKSSWNNNKGMQLSLNGFRES